MRQTALRIGDHARVRIRNQRDQHSRRDIIARATAYVRKRWGLPWHVLFRLPDFVVQVAVAERDSRLMFTHQRDQHIDTLHSRHGVDLHGVTRNDPGLFERLDGLTDKHLGLDRSGAMLVAERTHGIATHFP